MNFRKFPYNLASVFFPLKSIYQMRYIPHNLSTWHPRSASVCWNCDIGTVISYACLKFSLTEDLSSRMERDLFSLLQTSVFSSVKLVLQFFCVIFTIFEPSILLLKWSYIYIPNVKVSFCYRAKLQNGLCWDVIHLKIYSVYKFAGHILILWREQLN